MEIIGHIFNTAPAVERAATKQRWWESTRNLENKDTLRLANGQFDLIDVNSFDVEHFMISPKLVISASNRGGELGQFLAVLLVA